MKENSIIEKIIADAEAKANLTVADAERAAADTLKNAEIQAENTRKEQFELLEKKNSDYVEKRKINARLDCNKLILGAKRDILDEVFALALDKLTKLPEKDYVELCSRLIEKYAEEGDEIILSASCRYREKINALPAIKALSLKTGKIASFAGGVILANEKTDKNLTFEALIALEKEKKQAEIAGKLFG